MSPGSNTVYLETQDVERPATPLGEWNIDTTGLPVGVLYRALFDIWVDATGKVTRADIASLTPDDAAGRSALKSLELTQFVPAQLADAAVANVMHIELSFGLE